LRETNRICNREEEIKRSLLSVEKGVETP